MVHVGRHHHDIGGGEARLPYTRPQMIDSAIIAALVAGAISGIVSLARIWYQGRRSARDAGRRLIVA